MSTYKFPMNEMYGVMIHISGYKDMVVTSLTNDGVDYTVTVNIPIHEEQVQHLNEAYGLVEVVE